MSDEIDRANDHAALILEHQIAAARQVITRVSAFVCEHCDRPIPEARRKVISGCTLCADCQAIDELKRRHYRSI
ncbi:TraR/DksA C4-type zinc finger protein [Morganella morganii]|uniref:TraR/DksA C4-type zinc finger protein n=1 Tax=Morganella morganii TaxID=582 RepID=UPI0033152E68